MNPKLILLTASWITIIYLVYRNVKMSSIYRRNAVLYPFCDLRRQFISGIYNGTLDPRSLPVRVYLEYLNHIIHHFDNFRAHLTLLGLFRAISRSRDDIKYEEAKTQLFGELSATSQETKMIVYKFHKLVLDMMVESSPVGRTLFRWMTRVFTYHVFMDSVDRRLPFRNQISKIKKANNLARSLEQEYSRSEALAFQPG